MTMTDLKLRIDTLWYELVEFAQSIWRDLTDLLLSLWHVWKMLIPGNPALDPVGPAMVLIVLFGLMLWFLPKERY